MLTDEIIHDYAARLDAAEQSCQQIDALTMTQPDMDLADAYRIQKTWVDMKLARGRKIVGKKIGLTSRAMQQAMKIDEPDFGILLDDMQLATGCAICAADYPDPRIEVELAFMLKRDLAGDDLTLADILQATDYVTPALELIAARSWRVHPQTGYVRTVRDTIADNAANAAFITGDKKFSADELDLPWVAAALYYNGVPEETGLAAGVLGHPAKGIIWLARRIAPFGMALRAGELILSGSFTRPVICRAGDNFVADYGPLGKLSFDVI